MNLLFIHGNFPGQFLDIAPFLARNVASRTVFLTESNNPQGINLEGVELVQFELHRQPTPGVHTYVEPSELAVLRGQAVLRALAHLQRCGFIPDVAVVHGGAGFGLYLKTLLPTLRLITYMEWFFRPDTSQHLSAEFSFDDSLAIQTRNWPIVQELIEADQLVCPTAWQRQQFPQPWREQIQVIFDGVDTRAFAPPEHQERLALELNSGSNGEVIQIPQGAPLLTYATRGMEPMRGFAEFMRAAAFAQQRIADLHVVVAGNDWVPYSYGAPNANQSWKTYLLDELQGELDPARLHFPGLVNYGELIRLFQRSDLHCYFTRPYVISWGLFQAAACGTPLLINRFEGFLEVFRDIADVRQVELENQAEINAAVLAGLKSPLAKPAASNLREGLELTTALRAWRSLLLN